MDYNREPCRPVYTQQQATSSLKAYNLAFELHSTTTKTQYDLEPEEELTAYYAHSARQVTSQTT